MEIELKKRIAGTLFPERLAASMCGATDATLASRAQALPSAAVAPFVLDCNSNTAQIEQIMMGSQVVEHFALTAYGEAPCASRRNML